MEFTTVNGMLATLLRRIEYKGNVIEKIKRRGMEYYTVNHEGWYWKLRDAKSAVDNEAQ